MKQNSLKFSLKHVTPPKSCFYCKTFSHYSDFLFYCTRMEKISAVVDRFVFCNVSRFITSRLHSRWLSGPGTTRWSERRSSSSLCSSAAAEVWFRPFLRCTCQKWQRRRRPSPQSRTHRRWRAPRRRTPTDGRARQTAWSCSGREQKSQTDRFHRTWGNKEKY